ncbi:MAG: PAS domain S-box protein, partial [Comamonadaceae bacterium]
MQNPAMSEFDPAREEGRLAALQRLDVMDTPAEALLDSLAGAAAALCGTPIALVTLVERDRQWIKANVGLPGLAELPRGFSPCTGVIQSGEMVEIVEPATLPLPDGSSFALGYYVGVPLKTAEGHVVGTLCVLDTAPHAPLAAGTRGALQELARAVMHALVLRRAAHRTLQSSSEHMFRQLSESCPVGIFYTDAHGRTIYTNREYQALFGLTLEQTLGDGWAQSLHSEDRDLVLPTWRQIVAGGQSFDYVFRVCQPDGSVRHAWARGRPIAL